MEDRLRDKAADAVFGGLGQALATVYQVGMFSFEKTRTGWRLVKKVPITVVGAALKAKKAARDVSWPAL